MRLGRILSRISFAVGYLVALWFYLGAGNHIPVPKLLPCLILSALDDRWRRPAFAICASGTDAGFG
jgi:hypothetical protein